MAWTARIIFDQLLLSSQEQSCEISKNVSHQMSFVVNRRFASPPTV
jgi:hypothetical protein